MRQDVLFRADQEYVTELQSLGSVQCGKRYGIGFLVARFEQVEQRNQLRHRNHGLFICFGFAIHPAGEILHVLPFVFRLTRFVAVE